MATLWILAEPSPILAGDLAIQPADQVEEVSGLVRVVSAKSEAEKSKPSGLAVVAGSVSRLRVILPLLDPEWSVTELRVFVEGPRSMHAVLPPRAPIGKASIRTLSVRVYDEPILHTRLLVRLRTPALARHVLAACLAPESRVFGSSSLDLRVGLAAGVPLRWATGSNESGVIDLALDRHDPRSDVHVLDVSDGDGGGTATSTPAIRIRSGRPHWVDYMVGVRGDLESYLSTDSPMSVSPVDTHALSPVGLWSGTTSGRARTGVGGQGHVLIHHDDGTVLTRPSTYSGLSEVDVHRMRGLRTLHVTGEAFDGPAAEAAFVVQAACAAIPVLVDADRDPISRLLGDRLMLALERGTQIDRDNDVEFEEWLIQLHRTAYAQFGVRAVWRREAAALNLPARSEPTVSVILATNRPGQLPQALKQIDRQSWDQLELVLGLHGITADEPPVKGAIDDFGRPVRVVAVDASLTLGEVLGRLTEVASGDLIAKMDDDDWYGAEHLADLVRAAEFSRANVVGCGAEFVYLSDLDVTIRRQARSGHRFSPTLAGGSLMVSKDDLRAVGGWRPVPRAVDTALIRSVLAAGGATYRSHGLGFLLYRGSSSHTWDQAADYFLRSADARWEGFALPPCIAPGHVETVSRHQASAS